MKTNETKTTTGDAHADALASIYAREASDRDDLRLRSVPDLHAAAEAARARIPVVVVED